MNELLRAHVTRVGFNLTLTKNQIAELVYLDARLADTRTFEEQCKDGARVDNQGRNILSNSVGSCRALMARGLVAHHPPPERRYRDGSWIEQTTRDSWSFTPAGRAVIALLKESGLWDEVAAEIPWVRPPAPHDTYTDAEEVARLRARLEQVNREKLELREQVGREQSERGRAEMRAQRAEVAHRRLREQVRDLLGAAGIDVGDEEAA